MGFMYMDGKVRGPKGEDEIKFLLDSGAMYTLLPHATWTNIGLEPRRSMRFTLADGSRITRHISECEIVLSFGEGHTPVILGEPGDQALLGVVTLEEFGYMLNPFKGEIEQMKMIMMRVG
jgi:aspartyl protease family protein